MSAYGIYFCSDGLSSGDAQIVTHQYKLVLVGGMQHIVHMCWLNVEQLLLQMWLKKPSVYSLEVVHVSTVLAGWPSEYLLFNSDECVMSQRLAQSVICRKA